MAIDVGHIPEDFIQSGTTSQTRLLTENAANASGIITEVKTWWDSSTTTLTVGLFYNTTGNDYKCRDSTLIGAVTSGSEQTFSGLSIDVVTGDYIGFYNTDGEIEYRASGHPGVWYYLGEAKDPGDEVTYTWGSGDTASLYGTGTEGGAPETEAYGYVV